MFNFKYFSIFFIYNDKSVLFVQSEIFSVCLYLKSAQSFFKRSVRIFFYSIKSRHIIWWKSGIPVKLPHICKRSDYTYISNRISFINRQQTIFIFKKYNRLLSHLQCSFLIFLCTDIFNSNLRIWIVTVGIKESKPYHCAKTISDRLVYIFHFNQTEGICFSYCILHLFSIIRKTVNTCFNSCCHSLCIRAKILMLVYRLKHITTIRHHMMKSPPVFCIILNITHNHTWYTVYLVICRHHSFRTMLFYNSSERLMIIFVFISWIY